MENKITIECQYIVCLLKIKTDNGKVGEVKDKLKLIPFGGSIKRYNCFGKLKVSYRVKCAFHMWFDQFFLLIYSRETKMCVSTKIYTRVYVKALVIIVLLETSQMFISRWIDHLCYISTIEYFHNWIVLYFHSIYSEIRSHGYIQPCGWISTLFNPEWKKPDTKKCVLYDSLPMKSWNRLTNLLS